MLNPSARVNHATKDSFAVAVTRKVRVNGAEPTTWEGVG